MNLTDHARVLESIARLTEKRDRESLELCLMQTMFELLTAEEIALYQVEGTHFGLLMRINPEGHWIASDNVSDMDSLESINNDSLFADCLKKQRMQMELVSTRISRYAFPIFYQGRGVGVLCLEAKNDLGDDRRLIAGFLRIYQNYLALINENAHDKLTGLLNRKTFDERFITILLAARQDKEPLRPSDRRQDSRCLAQYWLAIIDIDHFKRINDNYGHLYGDEVLLLMANLMRSSFRRRDLLFRYGGEEFVIVLKTATFDQVSTVLERFRQTVEQYKFPQVGQVTISIGFTEIHDSEIPSMTIERADRALYYVKDNGRNHIRNYEQLIAQSALKISQQSTENEVEFF